MSENYSDRLMAGAHSCDTGRIYKRPEDKILKISNKIKRMIKEEWGADVAQVVLATDGIDCMDARTAGFALYQQKTGKYAVYPANRRIEYVTLGLTSEAGEVAGKVKKMIRDNGGVLTDVTREGIVSELGDVMWYVSQLCNELGIHLADVVDCNIAKLEDRYQRNQIHGSGDNR